MQKFPCLVKRDGNYYVRMKVPKDLVSVLKRGELKRSPNTKDAKEARRAYQRVYGDLLRTITTARDTNLHPRPTRFPMSNCSPS